MLEHNEKINQLLGQIDIVKETEEKQQEILKTNEELSNMVDDLKLMLSQKEKEVNNIQQKEHLTKEMIDSLLDVTHHIGDAPNRALILAKKIRKAIKNGV